MDLGITSEVPADPEGLVIEKVMPGYLLPTYIEIKKELEGKNFILLVLYRVSAPPSPNQGWHQPGIQVRANWNLIAHTLGIQMVPKTAKAPTGHGHPGHHTGWPPRSPYLVLHLPARPHPPLGWHHCLHLTLHKRWLSNKS